MTEQGENLYWRGKVQQGKCLEIGKLADQGESEREEYPGDSLYFKDIEIPE